MFGKLLYLPKADVTVVPVDRARVLSALRCIIVEEDGIKSYERGDFIEVPIVDLHAAIERRIEAMS